MIRCRSRGDKAKVQNPQRAIISIALPAGGEPTCEQFTGRLRRTSNSAGLAPQRHEIYESSAANTYFFELHDTRVTVLPSDHSQYCRPSSPTQVLHQVPSVCFNQTEQLGTANAAAPANMLIARTAPKNNFLRFISPSFTRLSAEKDERVLSDCSVLAHAAPIVHDGHYANNRDRTVSVFRLEPDAILGGNDERTIGAVRRAIFPNLSCNVLHG